MAAKVAKITGVPELLSKLRDLGQTATIEKIAYRATFGTSKDLRELARANAYDAIESKSGALIRGFAMKRIKNGGALGYTVGVRSGNIKTGRSNKRAGDLGPSGSGDPFYWWFLEFGTVHNRPFGFFQRAIATVQSKAKGQIIAAGTKAVLDSGNRALKKFGSGK